MNHMTFNIVHYFAKKIKYFRQNNPTIRQYMHIFHLFIVFCVNVDTAILQLVCTKTEIFKQNLKKSVK